MDFVTFLRESKVLCPDDLLEKLVASYPHLTDTQLARKIERYKNSFMISDPAKSSQGYMDNFKLSHIVPRPLSAMQNWFITICLNWSSLSPEEVTEQVRSRYETTASRSSAIKSLRIFARMYYPKIPVKWLKNIKLTRIEYRISNRAYMKDIQRRADDPIIVKLDIFFDRLQVWILSDELPKLGLALLMATGRRSIEIA